MEVAIDKSWKQALKNELESKRFKSLSKFIREEYKTKKIYPESKNIFRALNLTPIDKVKVVIIGQDPYHGSMGDIPQAHGLSFSVDRKIKNPPSLQNIFKEIELEYGAKSEAEEKYSGDLSCWSKQGVLLLNSVLTVEYGKAASHSNRGWEELTDEIIKIVSKECDGAVFLFWGSYARKKVSLIDKNKHLVLESVHPSPLSAYGGFFGSGHFKKANEWLKNHNKTEIIW